ncbi:hypothetical protein ACFRJ8_14920 [Arthrobacter sp. NPDC056886]|uniref:hypothetical protein n=1 Tax=Arthrobacter sp. NPDC056886 TaxID=3345960 RepID=UPI00366F3DDD
MNQNPRNSTVTATKTFRHQHVLNDVQRDEEAEKLALTYMNKYAPDLVGMVLGHVL